MKSLLLCFALLIFYNAHAQPSLAHPNYKSVIMREEKEGLGIESMSALQFKYAMMLNVDVESLSNLSLYTFIDKWYGSHYQMGGNTQSGTDCSGFTSTLVQNIYCASLPRSARDQFAACEPVSKEQLKEGDLVFFNTMGGISHVGVYLANGNFVHASTNSGVIISNLQESYYSSRFVGGGRPK